MKLSISKIIVLTCICSVIFSLIFSIVFITVQRIDTYYNPGPLSDSEISIKKIK